MNIVFSIYKTIFESDIFFSYINDKKIGFKDLIKTLNKKKYEIALSNIYICFYNLKDKTELDEMPNKRIGNYNKNDNSIIGHISIIHSEFIELSEQERKKEITNKFYEILILIMEKINKLGLKCVDCEIFLKDVDKINNIYLNSNLPHSFKLEKDNDEINEILKEFE